MENTENGLWLVIPCYNEADRLKPDDFKDALAAYSWLRLCFVNDASTDRTLEVLSAMEMGERVTVLSNQKNQGKANSVRAGVLYGLDKSDSVFFGYWDADLATPFSELEGLYNELQGNTTTELAMGSRVKMLGKNIERKRLRHYLGRVFATLACIILRVAVYDTQCGAKIFSRNFAEICFREVLTSSWCFDIELLLRLQKHYGRTDIIYDKVIEYPLGTWIDVDGSKLKFHHMIKVFKSLYGLYLISRKNKTVRAGDDV